MMAHISFSNSLLPSRFRIFNFLLLCSVKRFWSVPLFCSIQMNKLQASHTSLAVIESLTMPLVQEVVLSADVRCKECQKRIFHVLSRINAVTDSVVVDVLEKKVTVICKYPAIESRQQITTSYKNPLAFLRMLFFSSFRR